MIETGIVLLVAAALTAVLVADRILKGEHARQNDDLRLHVMKKRTVRIRKPPSLKRHLCNEGYRADFRQAASDLSMKFGVISTGPIDVGPLTNL